MDDAGGPAWNDEPVGGWGMAVAGRSRVFRPETRAQVQEVLARSREPLALRGAGRSYGDASMLDGGRVLDLGRLDRVLDFDVRTGVARVEPGVTVRGLWRTAIRHGFWPAVVPGTMHVSLGGAAAMNVHGKNHFAVGSFGEHVREFTLATPAGKLLVCSREQHADVFHAALSGFGMLGCFVEIVLETKRVHSGRLRVWALPARDLADGLQQLEAHRTDSDYLVGWLDLHARGARLGRGLLHRARRPAPGEDPEGERMLDPALQDVPETLFGRVPKGWIWPGVWLASKLGATRLVNAVKYHAGFGEARHSPYLQSHGAFHFLLDSVPRWHWAFRPGGLIQFQPFVPIASAEPVLSALLEACQREGVVSYLGVLKRHRPDPFLMTHAVDGVSLAMDFAVPTSTAGRDVLWSLTRRLAETVLEAGGRFYYAKDATLLASSFERIHGAPAVERFRSLKQRLDPAGILQTDLSRRLMGPAG